LATLVMSFALPAFGMLRRINSSSLESTSLGFRSCPRPSVSLGSKSHFETWGRKEIGVGDGPAVGRGARYLKAKVQKTITHAMKITYPK